MNNFLDDYFKYVEKYIKKNYPKITINIINIDKVKNFEYEEKESPLHNNVVYLNKKFLSSVNNYPNLLEIGCGAFSILLDNKNKNFSRKDGIDIHEKDSRGRNTLANLIGSVSDIPTRSNFYDYCISNQSIEHWHEYGVSLSLGLSEISRVIKRDKGKMIINFPLFLHGKREFVQGDIEYIIKKISRYFSVKKLTFIYSKSRKYEGWKNCNQSAYRIKRFIIKKGIKSLPESFVCEVIANKEFDSKRFKKIKTSSIKRFINMYKDFTFVELIIKIIQKLKTLYRFIF